MIQYKKLAAALAVTAALGAVSATLASSYGTLSGTADVERPAVIEEVYYNSNFSNDDSGEYVKLKINAESISADDYQVKTGSDILESGEYSTGSLLIYENGTDQKILEKQGNIQYLEVDSFALSNSGQYVNLTYSGNKMIQEVDYQGNCGESDSYFLGSGCKEASHTVLGGGS